MSSPARNTILVAVCACLLLAGSGFTIMNAQFKTQVFSQAVSAAQFGTPLNMSSDGYNARYPALAASGSYVYVCWSEGTHGIYLRKSADYGANFSAALRLSSLGGVASSPVISANGSYLYVAWVQTGINSNVSQIFISSSSDYGEAFTSPQVLSGSVNSVTPAIAAWNSSVYVSWTSNTPGANGTFERTSNNGGVSFDPVFQSSGNRENGIAAYGTYAYVVSEYGSFSFTNDSGSSWLSYQLQQNGLQPWVSVSGPYVYVASESRNMSKTPEINLQVSSDNGMTFGPVMHPNGNVSDDTNPLVAADGSNVFLSFDSVLPTTSVWMVASSNNGTTWTSPYLAIDTNASSPPMGIAASGNSAFTIYGSAPIGNSTYWNAFISSTNDSGLTWSPGIDVSQNNVGFAAPETSIASAAVAVSGPYGYAAWMQNVTSSNSTNFQVFFSGPFSSPSSTIVYSTAKCCTFGTTTSGLPTITGSVSYTVSASTNAIPPPNGLAAPSPMTIFDLIVAAIVVALVIALVALFTRRKPPT